MTSRYVGTGEGAWHGDWYVYVPSVEDRLEARVFGDDAVRFLKANAVRSGYGPKTERKPAWLVTGFLGELAALHPIGAGALRATQDTKAFKGRGDYGPVEVRTTSTWQLYGFGLRGKEGGGLGGWAVVAKDAGRVVLCVEDRGADFAVMGWARADDIPRLESPLGGILAVIEPPDLRPLPILYERMKEIAS